MLGLLVILFLVIYLLLSFWVVKLAVRWAKATKRKLWLWGGISAFLMYNLMFWDFIPTILAYKYYCSTQAGFWIFKTPDQWMLENPEMEEDVGSREQITDFTIEKISNGIKSTALLNQRTYIIGEFVNKLLLPLLGVTKRKETLIDKKHSLTLARKITFDAGNAFGAPNGISDYKFWVNFPECEGKNGNASFDEWVRAVRKYANLGERND